MYLILLAVSALMVAAAWSARGTPVAIVVLVAAAVIGALAFCFHSLTVSDEGQWLRVRFGPLPLFGTRIEYADITAVEAARSRFVDGWGVHYLAGRGWSYNLWGFDVVVVHQGKRTVRIGSDDAENLAAFLQAKTGAKA